MNRRALAAATFVFLGGVWVVAAWLLWQSKVPSSLHLPHVDTASTFAAGELHTADSYDHGAILLWLGGIAVELVVFALYAWRGAVLMRESAAGPLGTGMLLGMLGFCLLWVAQVPFTALGVWWDRKHHVSNVGYTDAILGGWLALGFTFVSLCVALAIVMGLARWIGHRWWIVAAPVFVGLATLFAFVSPYLIHTHPIRDPQLQASVAQLEKRVHVGHIPVRVQVVSSDTSLPNAEAMGLGVSRRIVLWDTLIDGRFTDGEVRVVIAHELGHIERNHIWKYVGWYALFAFPGTFLIARVVRRRGGMGEPAAVPLSLLALVVLGLVALPVQNQISRHMEAEADWIALQTTHDPADAEGLFKTFVPTALTDPNPPLWEYLLVENHPTVNQRIAMARAWKAYAADASSAAQAP